MVLVCDVAISSDNLGRFVLYHNSRCIGYAKYTEAPAETKKLEIRCFGELQAEVTIYDTSVDSAQVVKGIVVAILNLA